MQAQGTEEEQARPDTRRRRLAHVLARDNPDIRWGLLYGVLLCNARAMGEFGAVSVLSGHVRGLTNTMPLQIELLYNDPGAYSAAFAVASLLALLGFVTLALKNLLEWRHGDELTALRGN
jgi:sulfate transport system permease protein